MYLDGLLDLNLRYMMECSYNQLLVIDIEMQPNCLLNGTFPPGSSPHLVPDVVADVVAVVVVVVAIVVVVVVVVDSKEVVVCNGWKSCGV